MQLRWIIDTAAMKTCFALFLITPHAVQLQTTPMDTELKFDLHGSSHIFLGTPSTVKI